MAKRALVVLAVGLFLGVVSLSARAQAIAESAVIHANSGISGSVARALGGNIQQGLSKTQSHFAYPPRTARGARRGRNYRGKAHTRLPGRSALAVSSVVGGTSPCMAPARPASSQAKPAAASQGNAAPVVSGNCVAKSAAPAASAKSTPNEITVSF